MKILTIISVFFFINSISQASESEFLYKGKSMADKAVAIAFYEEQKLSDKDGREVDICYSGDWEKAEKTISGPVSLNVTHVWEGGILDTDIYYNMVYETFAFINPC